MQCYLLVYVKRLFSTRLECRAAKSTTITLIVTTIQPRASCPRCHQPSRRVQSRYMRTVADLPWQGIAVRLHLQTRRFFCQQPDCAQGKLARLRPPPSEHQKRG
jgi:transposase